MNNFGKDNPSQTPQTTATDPYLEHRISRFLKEKADHITFTPAMRVQIMQKLAHQRTTRSLPLPAFAIALVVILVLLGATTLSFLYSHAHHNTTSSPTYTITHTLNVAPPLATGGSISSIDPTQRSFVYQPAHTSGIYYTANLSNPVSSNTLAMRYAQTMDWSPDGSALIATVSPATATSPALALVPAGGYMHVIRPNALAASWLPTQKNEVTFVTQQNQHTQLWSINTIKNTSQLLATLDLSAHIDNIAWSPNGKSLALLVGTTQSPSQSHAIVIMDAQTHALYPLVSAGAFTISTINWSPDSQYLAYTTIKPGGNVEIQINTLSPSSTHFSIYTTQLQGWSWSPDSKSLLYSDSGKLKTYAPSSNRTTTLSTSTTGQLISPFWLKDGRLVCLQISHSTTTLAFLSPHPPT